MLYELGRHIRSLSPGFEDSIDINRQFFAYSMANAAALQSMQAYLLGLFPGKGGSLESEDPATFNPPYKNLNVSLEGGYSLPNNRPVYPILYFKEDNSTTDLFLERISEYCPNVYQQHFASRNLGPIFGLPPPEITQVLHSIEADLASEGFPPLNNQVSFDDFFDVQLLNRYENNVEIKKASEKLFKKLMVAKSLSFIYRDQQGEDLDRKRGTILYRYINNMLSNFMNGTSVVNRAVFVEDGSFTYSFLTAVGLVNTSCLSSYLQDPFPVVDPVNCSAFPLPGSLLQFELISSSTFPSPSTTELRILYNGEVLPVSSSLSLNSVIPFKFDDLMNSCDLIYLLFENTRKVQKGMFLAYLFLGVCATVACALCSFMGVISRRNGGVSKIAKKVVANIQGDQSRY